MSNAAGDVLLKALGPSNVSSMLSFDKFNDRVTLSENTHENVPVDGGKLQRFPPILKRLDWKVREAKVYPKVTHRRYLHRLFRIKDQTEEDKHIRFLGCIAEYDHGFEDPAECNHDDGTRIRGEGQ